MKTKIKKVKYRKPTGWDKKESQTIRRQNVLKAHKGNLMSASKCLKALAKRTTDPEVRRKAKADAMHFEQRYKRIKGGS